MEFIGELGNHSSQGRTPSQKMMVFISIVLLLDGLRSFLTSGALQYEFIGVDCSFQVVFARDKHGNVSLIGDDKAIHVSNVASLTADVFSSVSKFIEEPGVRLSESDPVHDDVSAALKAFEEMKRKLL